MYRIPKNSEHIIEIEKSRFITYLFRVFNEEEAREYVHQIQKLHPHANHHCTAMIIGDKQEIQRSNDNGEPSGTAGMPMLESLRKNDMQDILAIVVRYFGGIKLGAGGLIRAYSKSVSNAIQLTGKTKSMHTNVYRLTFSYDFINKIDHFFLQHNIAIIEKSYDLEVIYIYHTTKDLTEALMKMSSGQFTPTFLRSENIEEVVK